MGLETALILGVTAASAAAQNKRAKEANQLARDAQNNVADPLEQIRLQARYNRVGARNPFGSSTYQGNESDGYNVVTEFSPQMQALMDRQFGLAMTDSNRYQLPQQFGGLQDALFGRAMQGVGNSGTGGRDWAAGRINAPAPPMSWGPRPQGGSAKPPNQGQLPPFLQSYMGGG